MAVYYIDINCDLGEGGKHDAQIMPLISSCNIACGGHFGDEATMAKTVKLALENKVNIGAHPSYPDKENFGRKALQIKLSELRESIYDQIERIDQAVRLLNGKLHHVKPHGALYNDLMSDPEKSELMIEIVRSFNNGQLMLFVPPNSMIQKMANGKLKTMTEGFADRNYEKGFKLVSRSKKHALLTQKEAVLDRVANMVKSGKVYLKTGEALHAEFDTICMHGDTENCLEILYFLHEKLPENNIKIYRS